jgi:hypothetical protein
MDKCKYLLFFFILTFSISCESMVRMDEIDEVMSKNDLNIILKVDAGNDYELKKIFEKDTIDGSYLKIDVVNSFAIRGKTEIDCSKKYRLSITLQNENANPVITYSYWKGRLTSVRNFTVAGKNGNPPTSKTQEVHDDWVTFYEIIDAQEGEDGFMLSIFCQSGTFYLKNINIEEINNNIDQPLH